MCIFTNIFRIDFYVMVCTAMYLKTVLSIQLILTECITKHKKKIYRFNPCFDIINNDHNE